jgi:hypothetical protein
MSHSTGRRNNNSRASTNSSAARYWDERGNFRYYRRNRRWYCKDCSGSLNEDKSFFYKGVRGPFCRECIIEMDGEFSELFGNLPLNAGKEVAYYWYISIFNSTILSKFKMNK